MGAPRKSAEEKKQNANIWLPGWLIDKLKEHGNRNVLVESLLKDYFGKKGN